MGSSGTCSLNNRSQEAIWQLGGHLDNGNNKEQAGGKKIGSVKHGF